MSTGRPGHRVSGWWIVVGLLAVAALLLRLGQIGQSLALDEMLTWDEIHRHSLSDLVHQMRAHGEDNPPLYYALAWLGARAGDDTVMIRLPSLVLGTATVPLLYALGGRTVGRGAGALAAGFAALSPFMLFYSVEARAYATAVFVSALATFALVRALEDHRRRWWVGYAVCATALLYTHYVAAFVVAAHAAWALLIHRSRWRPILLTHGAAAFAFLPWALTAKGGNFAGVVGGPLRPAVSTLEALVAVFPGQPFSQVLRPSLEAFPGVGALVLVLAGVVSAVILGLVARPARPDATRPALSHPVALMAALALAAPLGVFLYAVVKHDIFLSRYFSPSLPGFLLLVSWLLVRPRGALKLVPVGLAALGVAIGTAKMFDERFRRPPMEDVARFIRAGTRPGDTVVEVPLVKLEFFTRPLHAYLEGERSFSLQPGSTSEAWRRASRGGRVAIVSGALSILPLTPVRWGPGLCFRRVARRAFRGAADPGVAIYGLDRAGRACLRAGPPVFGRGFGPLEEDLAHQWRWTVAPSARFILVNPTGRPRTVRMALGLARSGRSPGQVVIRYPGGAKDEVVAAERPANVARVLRLAPGRSSVTLSTQDGPVSSSDSRRLYVRVVDLRLG